MSKGTRRKKVAVSAITVLPISGAIIGASCTPAEAAIGNASVGTQITTAAIGNAFVAKESTAIGNAFTAVAEIAIDLGGSPPSQGAP